jgi:hypothetical protein
LSAVFTLDETSHLQPSEIDPILADSWAFLHSLDPCRSFAPDLSGVARSGQELRTNRIGYRIQRLSSRQSVLPVTFFRNHDKLQLRGKND